MSLGISDQGLRKRFYTLKKLNIPNKRSYDKENQSGFIIEILVSWADYKIHGCFISIWITDICEGNAPFYSFNTPVKDVFLLILGSVLFSVSLSSMLNT